MKYRKPLLALVATLSLVAVGSTQLKQVIKILGVGAAVQKFGPDIDRTINKISGFKATNTTVTKVVPIISGGINSRKAVGAAQVMGPRNQVARVKAVAMIEQDLFGREIEVSAMIPIESDKIVQGIQRVDGVGVSGIVDLRL